MPQRLPCEVIKVVNHGERVYSVFLKPASLLPRFLPGQFLHLALDPYNVGDFWPESRIFSIASPPTNRSHLQITYSVKGQFTARMESEIHAGRQVWIKLPYGEFTINPKKDACLLAGGTGITAFTAFLSSLTIDYAHSINLFYGARCPDLLIYRTEVQDALNRCPALQVTFMAEQFSDGTDCLPGRIDLGIIWKNVPNPMFTTYYISGPPEMLRFFTYGLSQRGVNGDHILIDAWE